MANDLGVLPRSGFGDFAQSWALPKEGESEGNLLPLSWLLMIVL